MEGPWVIYNKNGNKSFTGVKFLHEGTGTYKNGVKVSD